MQAHLGLHTFQSPRQEMRGAHPAFDRVVWMLDRRVANADLVGIFVETCLRLFKQVLMFSTGRPTVPVRRAADLKRTTLAVRVPVLVIRHTVLNVCKAVDERLAGAASVFVFLPFVD